MMPSATLAFVSISFACLATVALSSADDATGALTASRLSGMYQNLEYSPLAVGHSSAQAQTAPSESKESINSCPNFVHITLTHARGKMFRMEFPGGILDPTGECPADRLVSPTEQYLANYAETKGAPYTGEKKRDENSQGFRFDSPLPAGLLQCVSRSAPQFERMSIGSLKRTVVSLVTSELTKIGVPASAITEVLLPSSRATKWTSAESKEAYRRTRAVLAHLSMSYLLTLSRANGAPAAIGHQDCLYVGGSLTIDEITRQVEELVDALALLTSSLAFPAVSIPGTTYYAVSSKCRVGAGSTASIENFSIEESDYSSKGHGLLGSGVEVDVRVNDGLPCAKTHMSRIIEAEPVMQQSVAGREALKTAEKLVMSVERKARTSNTTKSSTSSPMAHYLPKVRQRVQMMLFKSKVLVAYVDLRKCTGLEHAEPVALLVVGRPLKTFVCRHRGKLVSCLDSMSVMGMTETSSRTARSAEIELRATAGQQQLVGESTALITHALRHDACVFSSKSHHSETLHPVEIGPFTTPEASPNVSTEPSHAPLMSADVTISQNPVSAIDLIAELTAEPSAEPLSAQLSGALIPTPIMGTIEPSLPPTFSPSKGARIDPHVSKSDGEKIGADSELAQHPKPVSPRSGQEKAEGRTCFPGRALVTLRDGREVGMSEVRVSDEVEAAPGEFSPVLLLTHADANVRTQMVRIESASSTLVASPTHYVYANRRLKRAADVKVGDTLWVVRSGNLVVEHVARVSSGTEVGLFNPQTASGTLLVRIGRRSPLLVSAYTSAVLPSAAHAFLAPLRAAHKSAKLWVPALSGFLSTTQRVTCGPVFLERSLLLSCPGLRSATYL